MRKLILTALIGALIVCTQGQNVPSKTSKSIQPEKAHISLEQDKCSPLTKLLLSKMTLHHRNNEDAQMPDIQEKYAVHQRSGDEWLIGAFIKHNDQFDPDKTNLDLIHYKSYVNGIATVQVPLESLQALLDDPGIEYVEIANKIFPRLDVARTEVRAQLVHEGSNLPRPYKGSGVVVGVMDGGFDFTHPTYFTEDGMGYRVSTLWDQSNNFGSSPAGYNYGSHVTGAQNIFDWQNDNIFENGVWVSNGSHGMHTSGIAAGSGLGTSGSMTGFAPDAELAIVSFLGTDQGFADGASWLFSYAESVGKPCVVNMSLGKHSGPHDGTSFTDQIFDFISGPGKILVGACGNEGDQNIHLQKSFNVNSNDTVVYSFAVFQSQLGTDGGGEFDLWGTPGVDFRVAVNLFDVTQQDFVSWTPYVNASANTADQFTLPDIDGEQITVAIGTEASNPNNGKPHARILVDATQQSDNDIFVMLEVIAYQGNVQMWASDPTTLSALNFGAPFKEGDANYTTGELGGTGKSVITVGAYTTKNQWQSLQQGVVQGPFQASLGDFAPFTSKGPTADGRVKPDITAPGNVVVSSLNSDDPNEQANSPRVALSVTDGSKNWYFGAFQGTSMSSPVVAGTVALMLEVDPTLDYQTTVDILRSTAFTDGFTGSISSQGSNLWGWGKLDTYDAIIETIGLTGISNLADVSETIDVVPNPNRGSFHIGVSISEDSDVILSTLDGKVVHKARIQRNGQYTTQALKVSGVPNGLYLISIRNQSEYGQAKVSIQR